MKGLPEKGRREELAGTRQGRKVDTRTLSLFREAKRRNWVREVRGRCKNRDEERGGWERKREREEGREEGGIIASSFFRESRTRERLGERDERTIKIGSEYERKDKKIADRERKKERKVP